MCVTSVYGQWNAHKLSHYTTNSAQQRVHKHLFWVHCWTQGTGLYEI